MKTRAFTLVELLVALGIISVLVSILLPAVSKARRSAANTHCRSHLHDIGAQFQMYLSESAGRLPRVNSMPSLRPPLNDAPSIVVVLEPYAQGVKGVYECSADRITQAAPAAPPGFETYFAREGCSYQYNPLLGSYYAGQHLNDTEFYKAGKQNLLPLLFDYEAFHGEPGQPASTNYLFADMHVADFGQ